MAVEVRSISARAVRRRKMRPLVEAVVFDATGSMRATFFNQPWLVERYPPRTRLLLHGKADGRGRLRRLPPCALGAAARRRAGRPRAAPGGRALPGHPRSHLDADPDARPGRPRGALGDVVESCRPGPGSARGCPIAPRALAAMHFPRARGDLEAGRRRLAYEELLLAQLAVPAPSRAAGTRSRGAAALTEEPTLSARWLERRAALHADGRPAPRDRRRSAPTSPRARPMQRLLMGEVGSGKTVVALLRDAAGRRARPPGGADGADGDARRTALRDDPAAARRRSPVSAALLTGSTPARRRADTARQAGKRRAVADRRHARPDRARRRLPLAGRGGRSTSSTASACASARRSGRARARPGRTSCT